MLTFFRVSPAIIENAFEVLSMASQYFHLQKQCNVQERLIVGLHDKNAIKAGEARNSNAWDSTTFIYHSKKVEDYFSKNLPIFPLFIE